MTAASLPPTVFLVDDDPLVLRALARLVRSVGWKAAAFASPAEFLAGHDAEVPGCLVLDVTMPGVGGLELQTTLNRQAVHRPVIFLTGNGDIPMSVRAMKAGAVNFLSKPVGDEELLAAIREALARDAEIRAALTKARKREALLARLTPREYEVMCGVVAGLLNKEIAARLGTAEKTVKVHRGRVMEKLEVTSLADLVRLAERAGLADRAESAYGTKVQ